MHTLLCSQICTPPKMRIDMFTNLPFADLSIFCSQHQESKFWYVTKSANSGNSLQICLTPTCLFFAYTISRIPSTHWYMSSQLPSTNLLAVYLKWALCLVLLVSYQLPSTSNRPICFHTSATADSNATPTIPHSAFKFNNVHTSFHRTADLQAIWLWWWS